MNILVKLVFSFTLLLALYVSPAKAALGDPEDMPNMAKISDSISVLNNNIGTELNALTSPGLIISKLLPYLLTIAGLILLIMLIMGGFAMMTAGTDAKAADAGKQRITTAIIGFVIIFAAFWITQILEIILGIKILQ